MAVGAMDLAGAGVATLVGAGAARGGAILVILTMAAMLLGSWRVLPSAVLSVVRWPRPLLSVWPPRTTPWCPNVRQSTCTTLKEIATRRALLEQAVTMDAFVNRFCIHKI